MPLKLIATLSATVSFAALLSGCATPAAPAAPSSDIHINSASMSSGRGNGDIDLGAQTAPSLDDLVNAIPQKAETLPDSQDKLRAPAMRDAALAYGAQGGLASVSVEINRNLKERAGELSKTYDFSRFMIKGPNGAMVLPPVISEARDTWESQDGGKALRIADKYYEIVAQPVFTPVAPLWHTYLIRQYSLPKPPPDALLPKNDAERKYWGNFVRLGWDMGAKQAREIFQADLRRLERDFTGMVRYRQLLDQNLVSAPVVAGTHLGVTGGDRKVRVNDRAVRITQDPKLSTDPAAWKAAPSMVTKEEAATPPGKTFIAPRAKQDAERLEPVRTKPVETRVTYSAPEPKAGEPRRRPVAVSPASQGSIAPVPAPIVESSVQEMIPDAAVAPARRRYF